MTPDQARKILDFCDADHAKLWLGNRMIGTSAISLNGGVFTATELEAIAVLMRERGA